MTRGQPELWRVDNMVVVRLEGEVDLRNVTAISSDIAYALGNDVVGLVVDLEATRYIDSVGIHMLFTLKRRLDGARQGIAILLDEESPIRNLLKMTSLDEVVDVRGTLAECVSAIEARAADAY